MKRILTLSAIIMAVVSCNSINPFLTEWENEYRIPDFSQIKEKHYIPAIEMGIRQQQSEIDAINLVNGYFSKVNSAINEEREKEVDLNIETLKEGSDSKLLVANDWTPSDLDKIKIIL